MAWIQASECLCLQIQDPADTGLASAQFAAVGGPQPQFRNFGCQGFPGGCR